MKTFTNCVLYSFNIKEEGCRLVFKRPNPEATCSNDMFHSVSCMTTHDAFWGQVQQKALLDVEYDETQTPYVLVSIKLAGDSEDLTPSLVAKRKEYLERRNEMNSRLTNLFETLGKAGE